jgi:hypothetical protein
MRLDSPSLLRPEQVPRELARTPPVDLNPLVSPDEVLVEEALLFAGETRAKQNV